MSGSVTLPVLKSPVFSRHICGDKFGTSPVRQHVSRLGMLYQSRLQVGIIEDSESSDHHREDHVEDATRREDKSRQHTEQTTSLVDEDDDDDDEMSLKLNPKQRLALTIRNWSVMAENDKHILEEGGVEALIALSGLEDMKLKRSCAGAFYHLSSRPDNRAKLLSLGAASGLFSIASIAGLRNWDVDRLCAMSLFNLSIEDGFESRMSKEGTVLSVTNLFGVRQSSLLQICTQTLFNLTCVSEDFPNLDRIAKVMLTIPSHHTFFDLSIAVVKSLVNIIRFPRCRSRAMDDGVLNTFAVILSGIGTRDNRDEMALLMATALRSMADSKAIRLDMVSKGSVDLIYQLTPFCNPQSILLALKALHDLLNNVSSFPSAIFEVAVNTATDVMNFTEDRSAHQYVSSILYTCTQQENCRKRALVNNIIKCLQKLLASNDPLTQFYAVAASGNVFFNNLCDNTEHLTGLLKKFVAAGFTVSDEIAIQGLALAVAMLSQETKYMDILMHEEQLETVLSLVLSIGTQSPQPLPDAVLECCCIAICRITLCLGSIDGDQEPVVAAFFAKLLHSDNEFVLESSLLAIRALTYNGICVNDLLTKDLIMRTAEIANKYITSVLIARTSCGVLAILSYYLRAHEFLCLPDVLSMLFSLALVEDNSTRELVGVCFCNLSTSVGPRCVAIDAGLMGYLARLSSCNNEYIQLLCARCICNLTGSEDKHSQLVDQNTLAIVDMICQVRTTSRKAKELCARALLNILTPANHAAAIASGVQRAFASIAAAVDSVASYSVCAAGLLIFTSFLEGRVQVSSRTNVMQALYRMVNCESENIQLLVARATCNLLSCDESRTPALRAGGFTVIKIISTLGSESCRKMAVQTIISLIGDISVHTFLSKEPIALVITVVMKMSDEDAFGYSIEAASLASHYDIFKTQLLDKGYVTSLICAILSSKIDTEALTEAAARSLCNLTMVQSHLCWLVGDANILVALHTLHSNYCKRSLHGGLLVAYALRNISSDVQCCFTVIEQRSMALLSQLLERYAAQSQILCRFVVYVFQNLARDSQLHSILMSQDLIEMLLQIVYTKDPISGEKLTNPNLTGVDVFNVVRVIDLVSTSASCRALIVSKGAVELFKGLSGYLDKDSRFAMACSLSKLSESPECRVAMVSQGAPVLLIQLSKTDDEPTQLQCASAIAFLSAITYVSEDAVASVLVISENKSVGEAKIVEPKLLNTVKNAIDSSLKDQSKINSWSSVAGRTKNISSVLQIEFDEELEYQKEIERRRKDEEYLLSRNGPLTLAKYSKEQIKDEKVVLVYDHSSSGYIVIGNLPSIAEGGMALALELEVSLPSMKSDRILNTPNRHSELVNVPIDMNPLSKDRQVNSPPSLATLENDLNNAD